MCESCATPFFQRAVVPRLVHTACRLGSFTEMRRQMVPQARGTVVEIGFGSGHNLAHYDPSAVERVIGVDPDSTMLDLARQRTHAFTSRLELVRAPAEEMPLDSAIADTVVVTYALCTIPDIAAALAEARRVLKPQGRLVFAEHARAETSFRRKVQDRLNGMWGQLAGGCNLNRDPEGALGHAGFMIERSVHKRFGGILWHLGTHVAGVAVPARAQLAQSAG